MTSDGPWRIMTAAYRRFLEDYLGRNLGLIAREIRRTDPDTLVSYRNWVTMTAEHISIRGTTSGRRPRTWTSFRPNGTGCSCRGRATAGLGWWRRTAGIAAGTSRCSG